MYKIFILNSVDEGVEPPLEVQELEEINFILMLDIFIVLDDVGEHVMHVVFFVPPID
jgi:hypothetical protein